MKTIDREFQDFMEQVHPEGVPPEQYDSMQMAFYGGATTIITAMEVLGDKNVSTAEAVQVMEGLKAECEAFAKTMEEKGKG